MGNVARGVSGSRLRANREQCVARGINDTVASARVTGRIELDDGKTETLRCIGYYRSIMGSRGLGLALRCASPSSRLELRAELLNAAGSQISGTWEERTFNVTGAIGGKIDGNALRMNIAGPGFNGTMQASLEGTGQRIALATEGTALKTVTINFERSEEQKRRGSGG
ncbi:MAG TPA: hypothetical protein PKE16_08800 [Hyphomicrobium sp.]|nr:hypothetical protein [Hyphomicrobium sp.]